MNLITTEEKITREHIGEIIENALEKRSHLSIIDWDNTINDLYLKDMDSYLIVNHIKKETHLIQLRRSRMKIPLIICSISIDSGLCATVVNKFESTTIGRDNYVHNSTTGNKYSLMDGYCLAEEIEPWLDLAYYCIMENYIYQYRIDND